MNRPYPRLLGGRFAEWTEGATIVPREALLAPKSEAAQVASEGALPCEPAREPLRVSPMPREERTAVDPPSALALEGTFAPLALGGDVLVPEGPAGADDRPADAIESERARISRLIALTTIALLGIASVAIGLRISLTYATSNSDSDTALLQAQAPLDSEEARTVVPPPSTAQAPRIDARTATATSGSVSTTAALLGGGTDTAAKAAPDRATPPRTFPAPDSGSPPATTVHFVPIKSTFEVQN
jgi:hypothetical protein